MEAGRREEIPQAAMSSSSSSFASYMNSPPKHHTLADATSEESAGVQANNAHICVEPPSAMWLQKFLSTYFLCDLCHKIVIDPVQILPNVILACRRCTLSRRVSTDAMVELPHGVAQAFEELYETRRSQQRAMANTSPEPGGSNRVVDDSIAARRVVRVKRTAAVPSGDVTKHVDPHATADTVKAASASAAAAAAAAAASAKTAKAIGLHQELRGLEDGETYRRDRIETGEASERLELMKKYTATMRNIQVRSRVSSKSLKKEADTMYERAEYTMALELYSKAIEQQPLDRLTRLSALYGNRSSAYFMAQRYNDCISDCMKAIELEPENVKTYTRAAKAAAVMGDLARAVGIMDTIPEHLLVDAILSEKKRYKGGLELYQRAERAFGTPEGDENWLMLVAQFSDAIPFRLRYAESLMKQKRYLRAVEALEVVSPSRRTPRLWHLVANCLYLSGFEHFEKARACLVDVQQLDESCANLLRLINIVDEGKQKGNSLFQQKKFAAAVEHYTDAINASENNHQILRILYCNRAAAHKELGRYREGIDDCTKAIHLDPEFSKAYARRARCQQQLNDFPAAIRDFKSAIQYDPSDHELVRELRNCEHNMAKEAEREKDYYYVLGVSRNCSEREIKLKYRELSLRWHPDKCISLPENERVHAERKFKIIGEAHTTLIDPVKRREYDLKLDRERLTRSGGFGGFATYSGDTFRGQANRYRAGAGGFW
ncbi:putative TPR-repeat protein [Trypanosoma grayi]|uniref:putative TPR-repeat protein n=1 Tax=Trypanosoma grayi TaxID=71804 RepID=UPI0004F41132|nr:putative TPR-repeat protein [Trypanosoma grayi]KEG13232.1 putative TPR-repeat protein [Trypanosoma grayi]